MQDWEDQYYDRLEGQIPEADPTYQKPEQASVGQYILGSIIGILALMVVFVVYPGVRHWAFFPILLSGGVASSILFTWLTGKRHTLDPLGLAALLFVQLLVVTPLYHLASGVYGFAFDSSPEALLGQVSFICALSLIPFFIGYRMRLGESLGQRIFRKPKVIDFGRLRLAIVILLILSIAANIYVRMLFRGVVFTERISSGVGKGPLIMVADSVCAAMVLWFSYKIALKRQRGALTPVTRAHLLLIGLLVAGFTIIMFRFRGSRSLMVLYLWWIGGVYHFSVKRVKAVTILAIFICLLPFLHAYKMYKLFGPRAWAALYSTEIRKEFEQKSGAPTMMGTVVGDIGRMNVWMYIKQEIDSGRTPLQLGRTYVVAALGVIPRAIWPNRPYGMNEVLTDMIGGKGIYRATREKSTRVAGLFGESYANFGILGPFIGMFFYGVILRAMGTVVNRCSHDPLIAFLLPVAIYFAVIIFMGDAGALVYDVLKHLAIPILIVWFSRVDIGTVGESLEYSVA